MKVDAKAAVAFVAATTIPILLYAISDWLSWGLPEDRAPLHRLLISGVCSAWWYAARVQWRSSGGRVSEAELEHYIQWRDRMTSKALAR